MQADRFTQKSLEAIKMAQSMVIENQNMQIDQPHLMAALLKEKDGLVPKLLKKMHASPEELLTACLVRRWRAYEEEHRLKELAFSNPERALRYFEFCLSLRAENDLIIEQRRTDAILAAFETIESDADLGREGSYEAAFLAYGLYGMFVTWARSGWKETPRELAALVSGRMLGGIVG